MSMAAIDWHAVGALSGEPLKRRVFSILRQAALAVNAGDAAKAKSLMRSAERQVELLEKIFNL